VEDGSTKFEAQLKPRPYGPVRLAYFLVYPIFLLLYPVVLLFHIQCFSIAFPPTRVRAFKVMTGHPAQIAGTVPATHVYGQPQRSF
jgi:hypothetical protein